jgi:hypothetical protein
MMRALTFSGILSENGFELEPGFVVDGEPAKPEGDLVVHVIGRRGDVTASTRLALDEPCLPGGERNAGSARVAIGLVPFPEAAIGLRVSLEGRQLLERMAAREPLGAEVNWPRELAGGQQLRWRASQKGCAAVLGYSSDDGRQWAPLSLPTVSDVIAFDATYLPGGAGRLELRVSDGLRTISLRSDPYNVQPKGWVLWVLAPADGGALAADLPVVLAAQAYHIEERTASVDGIHWSSSVDGDLGTGGWVRPVLSRGDHRITATANGRSVEVSVRVE